jgi:hypothetical protein
MFIGTYNIKIFRLKALKNNLRKSTSLLFRKNTQQSKKIAKRKELKVCINR